MNRPRGLSNFPSCGGRVERLKVDLCTAATGRKFSRCCRGNDVVTERDCKNCSAKKGQLSFEPNLICIFLQGRIRAAWAIGSTGASVVLAAWYHLQHLADVAGRGMMISSHSRAILALLSTSLPVRVLPVFVRLRMSAAVSSLLERAISLAVFLNVAIYIAWTEDTYRAGSGVYRHRHCRDTHAVYTNRTLTNNRRGDAYPRASPFVGAGTSVFGREVGPTTAHGCNSRCSCK